MMSSRARHSPPAFAQGSDLRSPAPLAPGPLCDPDNTFAALHTGHLIAQAERALPAAPQHARLALCWLTSHILSEDVDLWHMKLDGVQLAERDLGRLSLSARRRRGPPQIITLERRSMLIRDGREVISIARELSSEKPPGDQLESLLNFSLAALLEQRNEPRLRIRISDFLGSEIRFFLKRGSFSQGIKRLFIT